MEDRINMVYTYISKELNDIDNQYLYKESIVIKEKYLTMKNQYFYADFILLLKKSIKINTIH